MYHVGWKGPPPPPSLSWAERQRRTYFLLSSLVGIHGQFHPRYSPASCVWERNAHVRKILFLFSFFGKMNLGNLVVKPWWAIVVSSQSRLWTGGVDCLIESSTLQSKKNQPQLTNCQIKSRSGEGGDRRKRRQSIKRRIDKKRIPASLPFPFLTCGKRRAISPQQRNSNFTTDFF